MQDVKKPNGINIHNIINITVNIKANLVTVQDVKRPKSIIVNINIHYSNNTVNIKTNLVKVQDVKRPIGSWRATRLLDFEAVVVPSRGLQVHQRLKVLLFEMILRFITDVRE